MAGSVTRAHRPARSRGRRHACVALAAALAAATTAVADAPYGGWRLYTYDVPLEALGVPAAAAARYRARVREGPTLVPWDVGGVAHSLARELPRVMPAWSPRPEQHDPAAAAGSNTTGGWPHPGQSGQRVLYFLPIAPFVLCMSADEHRSNRSFGSLNGRRKGSFDWPRASLGAMTRASKNCSLDARKLCPAYASVLEWLVAQPSWAGREHLHVVPASFSPDVPRLAFACAERRGVPEAQRPALARLARSILLATEGRTWAWRADVAAGRLVHAPHYVPPGPYLLSARAGAELAGAKRARVAMVTVHAKACHRWDDPARQTERYCATSAAASRAIDGGARPPADAPPAQVRAALALAAAHATGRGTRELRLFKLLRKPMDAVRAFAAEYRSATFTLVPPGDSMLSARIYGALAALSIPVFLVPLSALPFGATVPWAELSVQLEPRAVVRYAAQWRRLGTHGANGTPCAHHPPSACARERELHRRLNNPLRALLDRLERDEPARVARMQSLVARHRWSVLHHGGSEDLRAIVPFDGADAELRGAAPPSEWPSAARSLAAELAIAAERRLRTRATDGDMRTPPQPSGAAAPRAARRS